ncbi:MAG: DNA-binding response regulator [Marinilabiliales bacterium]|nr:MAG: DNA-binding response regulator [Marinilabiliales bacterium]
MIYFCKFEKILTMVRAVIVDDEKASRDTLKGLLDRYEKEVMVVAEADSVASGLEAISAFTPDLVFLDIQMPDGSGFRLLEQIQDVDFNVIFITAFDQYAIKAFKYSAIDYLLKPIIPEDLKAAVKKHQELGQVGNSNTNVQVLLENLSNKNKEPQKIVLHTFEGMHVINTEDIIRCQSDDCYTNFHLADGKKIIVSKTLKEIEEQLKGKDFIRPHKSHLININNIKTFVRNDGGYIIMKDGSEIPVSRRKKESVIQMLNHL